MATHSSILAWEIPWTEEPSGLQSMGSQDGKESASNAGDPGLIPGLGRSPGDGNGNPLQYSCLENSMDRGAQRATVHGVAKESATERLHFHFSLSCFGGGNGSPLQCSCLENPRDSGAWWAAVYEVTQSWRRLKRLGSSRSVSLLFHA